MGRMSCRVRPVLMAAIVALGSFAQAADLPLVEGVELQPLASQAKRVAQALELLGSPLSSQQQAVLEKAIANPKADEAVRQIQQVLDPLCLAGVQHQPGEPREGRRRPGRPAADATRLARVPGEGAQRSGRDRRTAREQPQRGPPAPPLGFQPGTQAADHAAGSRHRWMDVSLYTKQPINKSLSGLALEYRVVQLYSRDTGKREAKLAFDVGQGTQDLGFRNELNVLFDCRAGRGSEPRSHGRRRHADHRAVRDPRCARPRLSLAQPRAWLRTSSSTTRSIAHNGETVLLPPGKYRVSYTRGPEYRMLERGRSTVPRRAARRTRSRSASSAGSSWPTGLVLRRSSRSRRRLRPLRIPDRRRARRKT